MAILNGGMSISHWVSLIEVNVNSSHNLQALENYCKLHKTNWMNLLRVHMLHLLFQVIFNPYSHCFITSVLNTLLHNIHLKHCNHWKLDLDLKSCTWSNAIVKNDQSNLFHQREAYFTHSKIHRDSIKHRVMSIEESHWEIKQEIFKAKTADKHNHTRNILGSTWKKNEIRAPNNVETQYQN